MRIDKLLFFLRFAKSRTQAQHWTETGHIRINGIRIERSSAVVRADDVVTLPKGEQVWVIRIINLPLRRGPQDEAKSCYDIVPQNDC